jgi:hypothetical protein
MGHCNRLRSGRSGFESARVCGHVYTLLWGKNIKLCTLTYLIGLACVICYWEINALVLHIFYIEPNLLNARTASWLRLRNYIYFGHWWTNLMKKHITRMYVRTYIQRSFYKCGRIRFCNRKYRKPDFLRKISHFRTIVLQLALKSL